MPSLNVNPPVFSDLSRGGNVYHRIEATNSLSPLENGIGIPNQWSQHKPDEPPLWGLHYSYLGKALSTNPRVIKHDDGSFTFELRDRNNFSYC